MMNWQADLLEDDGQYIFDGSDEDELDQTELDDNFKYLADHLFSFRALRMLHIGLHSCTYLHRMDGIIQNCGPTVRDVSIRFDNHQSPTTCSQLHSITPQPHIQCLNIRIQMLNTLSATLDKLKLLTPNRSNDGS